MHRECREHFPQNRFQKKPIASNPGMRHARAVMHAGISNPRWRKKRSQHSRPMGNPQFYYLARGPCAICPPPPSRQITHQVSVFVHAQCVSVLAQISFQVVLAHVGQILLPDWASGNDGVKGMTIDHNINCLVMKQCTSSIFCTIIRETTIPSTYQVW